jgi:UDP-glucose 4-epimerase
MDYITGSHGFLGTHLLQALQGREVVAIPHEKIKTVKLKPFDNFYFLSTYGNMYFHKDDAKIIQANVSDLIKVITQVDGRPFNSFVYMSTSSVKLPKQTMYSRTKKAAEEILLSFAEKYKRPICIIRPYSITGVGEQKEHLIPTLIRSCFTGEKLTFVPSPTHDFIDIDDIVAGIINLSSHRARGVFELGTGKKYTNQEVLELVEKATGKKANVQRAIGQLRLYDGADWVSSNFRARSYGWLPQKTLEQSITEQVADYLTNKHE